MKLTPILGLLAALLCGPALAASDDVQAPRPPWSEETLDLAAKLPVQDGGRVKPLSTYAGFRLLRLNSKRSLKTPWGERLDPTAWMLDCLFFPRIAETYECFRINNDEVLSAISLFVEGKRRADRYSYEELQPGRSALFEKAMTLSHKDEKQRSLVEQQLLILATNIRDFESLTHALDPVRTEYPVDSPAMKEMFDGASTVPLSGLLTHAEGLRALWFGLSEDDPEAEHAREIAMRLGRVDSSVAFFPPEGTRDEGTEWLDTADMIQGTFAGAVGEESLQTLASLEHVTEEAGKPGFDDAFAAFSDGIVRRAAERGEYDKVPLEVRFYKGDFFTRALVFYLLAFVLVAISWLKPGSKWLARGVWGSQLVATGLLIAGITMRCIIRGRPPVSTLYETILFITACSVLVALFIEYVNRQRIALAVAAVLGTLGMFLSMKYELKEAATAGDTMPSLVAVLDTNFWLATHVTTVTMGYSAGLLAAALAHVWIFGRMFGFRKDDRAFYKTVSRMVYGVLCFGLLFATVGTILGGVWANYSWGRFWGWDPKENGALMIVLWMLMVLHMRLGGYIREFGLAIMSILGGLVVAFSWWGVNLLGVGLHSYGFTSGVRLVLMSAYVVELGVVLAAFAWWLVQRGRALGPPGGVASV